MKQYIFFLAAFLPFFSCSNEEAISPNPVSENNHIITQSRNDSDQIVHQLTWIDENGVLQNVSYDANADTLINSEIALNLISTLTWIDLDGDGNNDEGIREFPGDLESSTENETGGRNVVCWKSDNHCFTSRFALPMGNQGHHNGSGN